MIVADGGRRGRNKPWSRDEIIIALDLYFRTYPRIPEKTSPEVEEVSGLLRRVQMMIDPDMSADYRNTNSVYLKMMNFHWFNPDHNGGMPGGSKLDREMMLYYHPRQELLHETAAKIRKMIELGLEVPPPNQLVTIDEPMEGMLLTRLHKFRERDRRIVKRKKEQVMDEFRRLACESCEFDFERAYRERGQGFIECHHNVPLSSIEVERTTRLEDLSLICSNCHRMIHRNRPWLTVDQVRGLLPG